MTAVDWERLVLETPPASPAPDTIHLVTLRSWAKTFAGATLSTSMAKLNARHPWSHNDYFHGWILANLPEPCTVALDVGCGRGGLVAALAPHVD